MDHICTILTKDSKSYHIELQTLKTFSTFFQVVLEDQPTDSLELPHISSHAFDYIFQFLQLHKLNSPKELSKPIITTLKLSQVMNEQDAELMERILELDTDLQLQIMNCAMYLQMDSFKKMLTYTLIQAELKQKGKNVKTNKNQEEEIRKEIGRKVRNLIEMEKHKQRLENQIFEEHLPAEE